MKSIAVAVAVVVLGLAARAEAHPLDIGYLRIEEHGAAVAITLDLERGVAGGLVSATDLDHITPRLGNQLATATYLAGSLASDRGACTWGTPSSRLVGKTLRMQNRAACPAGSRSLRWELPFVHRLPSTFQLLVKARGFGGESVSIIDRKQATLELERAASSVSFAGFVWSGVEHIGAAPSEWRGDGGWKLPDGIDHILFLLALLLGGGTLMRLVGIATGFTIGHSITLALAATGLVRIPLSVIEPLIALTIALAALEAMSNRYERHRWKIATGFGLIHGFGFAAALTELDLSTGDTIKALFGYNLGVELGQLAIVLVTAPLVLLLYRSPRTRRFVVPAAGAAIFLAGMYWFVQRAFA